MQSEQRSPEFCVQQHVLPSAEDPELGLQRTGCDASFEAPVPDFERMQQSASLMVVHLRGNLQRLQTIVKFRPRLLRAVMLTVSLEELASALASEWTQARESLERADVMLIVEARSELPIDDRWPMMQLAALPVTHVISPELRRKPRVFRRCSIAKSRSRCPHTRIIGFLIRRR